MNMSSTPLEGAGLGLLRALLGPLSDRFPEAIDFMEVAPENWIDVGGSYGRLFHEVSARRPLICHGLSLNLGGPAPLDEAFLKKVKLFLQQHRVPVYSEHLSYCADDGHLYDLMPIPFTTRAVEHVAGRIRRTQDILERRIAIENVSYYAAPGQEMSEIAFIKAVLEQADCELLIDINNIYVNSVNHGYDAEEFMRALPGERIAYAHIAGHYNEADDLIIDTHGADVIDPVWRLLETAYDRFGVFPTLLERDFNIPPLGELLHEVEVIRTLQDKHAGTIARRGSHA